MDIRSGSVAFGVTCPGSLMQQLQRENANNVRNIKSLQTSFSKHLVHWQCHASCKDPSIVADFIESIDALEELSILNYEPNLSSLWPAIFHQGKSLKTLAIHTPPQVRSAVWTQSTLKEVTNQLPNLKRLEMDIDLQEGERFFKNTDLNTTVANPEFTETGSALGRPSAIAKSLLPDISVWNLTNRSVLKQVTTMNQLSSILININLMDSASAFAEEHTWNAMGAISFPPLNDKPCGRLARLIFDSFDANCALEHLEVRFARRFWDDRAQFSTVARSIHVKREDGKGKVRLAGSWGQYLPQWPRDGVLKKLSDEGFAEGTAQWR